MTPQQRRAWIALDEWLGIALCLYLWRQQDRAFWPVLGFWAFCTYVVSYPLHWWACLRGK